MSKDDKRGEFDVVYYEAEKLTPMAYPGIFFGGGRGQQIQLSTERTGIWER